MPDKTTHTSGWDWAATPDPDWGCLVLGTVQRHEWLSLFPLIEPQPRSLPFELLADALEAGTVQVGEVGTGSVPEVAVENSGDTDVLVLDGEQLVGVLTQADLLKALDEKGKPFLVGEVMQRDFQLANLSEMIEPVFMRLQKCACRTIPVMSGGRLAGLVTMDNVGEFLSIQAALRK